MSINGNHADHLGLALLRLGILKKAKGKPTLYHTSTGDKTLRGVAHLVYETNNEVELALLLEEQRGEII